MPRVERTVEVRSPSGLHARPAAQFAALAGRFQASIMVEKDGREANARSLLDILRLGIDCGHVITVRADGDDAEDALNALLPIVERTDEAAP